MKKKIGYGMLLLLFFAGFGVMIYESGIKVALLSYVSSFLLILWIAIAVYLIFPTKPKS